MPRSFAGSRKDGNQKENDDALRGMGFKVWDTSALGGGFPDAVVCGYNLHVGATMQVLVEWKVPGGKLRPKEVKFFEEWPAGQVIMTTNPDDVARWFGRVE
jgi:hypothetical protein